VRRLVAERKLRKKVGRKKYTNIICKYNKGMLIKDRDRERIFEFFKKFFFTHSNLNQQNLHLNILILGSQSQLDGISRQFNSILTVLAAQ
jgi:hypothetical protein